jgi:hypothetical protein
MWPRLQTQSVASGDNKSNTAQPQIAPLADPVF